MSEKLKDLVGPNTLKRAKRTKHYKLASIIGQILYAGAVRTYKANDPSLEIEVYSLNPMQYVGEDCATIIPHGIDAKPGYVNVDRALREIRDHLETLAFREVID